MNYASETPSKRVAPRMFTHEKKEVWLAPPVSCNTPQYLVYYTLDITVCRLQSPVARFQSRPW